MTARAESVIDTPPRAHATAMLIALREWWKQYQEANVPEHLRPMVSDHVINEMAASQFKRKSKMRENTGEVLDSAAGGG
jgi:hypothetical protein